MSKYGNYNKEEVRTKLMGMGKNSMRKNYYRELMDRQKLLEEKNEELKALNDKLEERVQERTKELEASLTELKKAQDYLVQTERLVALGSLVKGISHEINTPLGMGVTTTSYLNKLIEQLEKAYYANTLSEEVFGHLKRNLQEAVLMLTNNLNRTVKVMEDFRTIAADESNYEYKMFNAKSYFFKIIHHIHSEVIKHSAVVDLECSDKIILDGYPGVYSQIVSNLLLNALVHGVKEGGHVVIRFEEEAETYVLTCSDDGAGMEQEVTRHMFEPFYSGSLANGAGLGMYNVYNLVTNHLSGTIEVNSVLGKGTTVTVRFPKQHNMK
ncbi:MAG: HAMP domain-containing histidine kinase [Clostridia bacterium]|nr:HAMP domain-containing histidine kinase [Clostridia bacterium]